MKVIGAIIIGAVVDVIFLYSCLCAASRADYFDELAMERSELDGSGLWTDYENSEERL